MNWNPIAANKEIERLAGLVEASKTAVADATKAKDAEIADLRQTIATFPGAKQDWEAQTIALKAVHSQEMETLKAEYEVKLGASKKETEAVQATVQKVEEVANAKAVEIVANLGVDPKVLPVDSNSVPKQLTPQEAAQEFNRLSAENKSVEASEFYAKNRALILAGMNIKA